MVDRDGGGDAAVPSIDEVVEGVRGGGLVAALLDLAEADVVDDEQLGVSRQPRRRSTSASRPPAPSARRSAATNFAPPAEAVADHISSPSTSLNGSVGPALHGHSGPCRETPGRKGNGDANQWHEDTLPRRLQDQRHELPDPGGGHRPEDGEKEADRTEPGGGDRPGSSQAASGVAGRDQGGGRGRRRRPASDWGLREVLDRVQGQRDRRGNG